MACWWLSVSLCNKHGLIERMMQVPVKQKNGAPLRPRRKLVELLRSDHEQAWSTFCPI